MSAQHLPRETYILREHYILLRFSAQDISIHIQSSDLLNPRIRKYFYGHPVEE